MTAGGRQPVENVRHNHFRRPSAGGERANGCLSHAGLHVEQRGFHVPAVCAHSLRDIQEEKSVAGAEFSHALKIVTVQCIRQDAGKAGVITHPAVDAAHIPARADGPRVIGPEGVEEFGLRQTLHGALISKMAP
jgi:hypothetical protein